MKKYKLITALVLFCSSFILQVNAATSELYNTHCSSCHGDNRLGLMGPALLPENLKRLKKKSAHDVIRNGRLATQMPAFKDKLTDTEINSLVNLVYTPLDKIPQWDMNNIKASHIVHNDVLKLNNKPVWNADPLNLFIVVELGDHHASLLDGDTFEPIHRFKTRFSLHGGPKYSPDGRYVYFGSRDGWITKYDIYHLKVVAEIRASINMRNIAISSDGRYLIAGNYLPHTLVTFSALDLSPLKVIPVENEQGKSSRVSAVYDAAPRNSFIAALKDLKQVWEISYEDKPPAGFSGWVHDYREDSGDAKDETRFPIRKIKVNDYLDDFFFNQSYDLIIGASRESQGQVVDIDLGRVTNQIDLPGMPHLGSGITWQY